MALKYSMASGKNAGGEKNEKDKYNKTQKWEEMRKKSYISMYIRLFFITSFKKYFSRY